MHKDTCETVVGKHWNEIGSIDWEGHFPVLDAKLRVVRVEFIDNIEDDEEYMPVEIYDGRALRLPRCETDAIDAYMTPSDFGRSHGSLLAIYDLCENPKNEEVIDAIFPLYADSGTITSYFAIIDRDFYFANREAIDRELMEHARDQADREYFAVADDCEPIGIAIVEGKGLVATFDWNGEKVQSLVGMVDREPGEGDDFDKPLGGQWVDDGTEGEDDFDPIVDKVDTEILAARNGSSAPRPSRIDMVPARENFVRIEGDPDLICDLLGRAITDREIDSYEVVDHDVPVLIDRADLDAFTRAVLGAVHSLDREIERMERGLAILCGPHRDIRLADAETARANLNRLVTILCNANKGGAK